MEAAGRPALVASSGPTSCPEAVPLSSVEQLISVSVSAAASSLSSGDDGRPHPPLPTGWTAR